MISTLFWIMLIVPGALLLWLGIKTAVNMKNSEEVPCVVEDYLDKVRYSKGRRKHDHRIKVTYKFKGKTFTNVIVSNPLYLKHSGRIIAGKKAMIRIRKDRPQEPIQSNITIIVTEIVIGVAWISLMILCTVRSLGLL